MEGTGMGGWGKDGWDGMGWDGGWASTAYQRKNNKKDKNRVGVEDIGFGSSSFLL